MARSNASRLSHTRATSLLAGGILLGWVCCWAPVLGQELELNSASQLPQPAVLIPEGAEELPLLVPDEPTSVGETQADAELIEISGEPILRGLIHEAYAEPLQPNPEPTVARKVAPPKPVNELVPDAKPEGANVTWIPGYWAWNDERNDYSWVSGVWRNQPVGRVWQPGYWTEEGGTYRWVKGFWTKQGPDGNREVVVIQEAPPASIEEGPTTPAPSEEHFWVPGVWQRSAEQYAWRPGFWTASQENWVWVPDHYSWTPSGCAYIPGYWDFTWDRRGTLYAPCQFDVAQLTPNVRYRPSRILDSSIWLANLWIGPGYTNYYYGSYYDAVGYTPWYSYYGQHRRYYDPFYTYYQWQFPQRYGIGLYSYINGLHTYYRGHQVARPSISIYSAGDYYRDRYRHRASSVYGDVRDLSARYGGRRVEDRYQGYSTRAALDRAISQGHATSRYDLGDRGRGNFDRPYGRGVSDGLSGRNQVDSRRYNRTLEQNQDALDRIRNRGNQVDGGVGSIGQVDRIRQQLRDEGHAVTQGERSHRPRPIRDQENRAYDIRQRNGVGQQSVNQVIRDRSVDPLRDSAASRMRANEGRNAGPSITTVRPEPNASVGGRRLRTEPRADNPQPRVPQPRVDSPTISQRRSGRDDATRIQSGRPQVDLPREINGPQFDRSRINRPRVNNRAEVTGPPVTRQPERPVTPQHSVVSPTPRDQSPGFTTHGMRRARGEDLTRQRDAMKKLMDSRKEKK